MPQSLAQLYMHLIFSTKERRRLLVESNHEPLKEYFGGTLRNLDSPLLMAGVMGEHVHLLYRHSKNMKPIEVVEEVKTATSKWLKTQGAEYVDFHWQRGYGLFSASASRVNSVMNYIKNQARHHHRMSFLDEMRGFLHRYGIEYDERYVWD